jgi:transcriptional regulator with XRE-family HTH domain
MPNKKKLNATASPAAFYGAQMRSKREAAGWTLDELGQRVFAGPAYLAQIERAERRPQPELGRSLDREFNTGRFFEDLAEAIRRSSKHAEYFAEAAEMEKLANGIHEHAPVLVPGLLQTEAYARAVIESADPFRPADEVNEKVAARLERAQRLDSPERPEYWVILHESLLRCPIGGPEIMSEQFTHLATVVRQKRAVLQVFPKDSGAHPALSHMVQLMAFPDAPPLVYLEGEHSGQLIDDPAMVTSYRRSYDLVRAAALSPRASLNMIESAAKDHQT